MLIKMLIVDYYVLHNLEDTVRIIVEWEASAALEKFKTQMEIVLTQPLRHCVTSMDIIAFNQTSSQVRFCSQDFIIYMICV